MRRISPKAVERRKAERSLKAALVAKVGKCEICGHDPSRVRRGQIAWALHKHEIARGPNRSKAAVERYAVLLVCFLCHEQLSSRKAWPEARQLAVLKRSRPEDYDLQAYNALVGRGPERITEAEVEAWL